MWMHKAFILKKIKTHCTLFCSPFLPAQGIPALSLPLRASVSYRAGSQWCQPLLLLLACSLAATMSFPREEAGSGCHGETTGCSLATVVTWDKRWLILLLELGGRSTGEIWTFQESNLKLECLLQFQDRPWKTGTLVRYADGPQGDWQLLFLTNHSFLFHPNQEVLFVQKSQDQKPQFAVQLFASSRPSQKSPLCYEA